MYCLAYRFVCSIILSRMLSVSSILKSSQGGLHQGVEGYSQVKMYTVQEGGSRGAADPPFNHSFVDLAARDPTTVHQGTTLQPRIAPRSAQDLL